MKNGEDTGPAAEIVSLYVAVVVCVCGMPLGVLALVAGRIVYGSWLAALHFYATHMGMAATSVVGILPVYGNKLHYLLTTSYLFTWAASHRIGVSWALSVSGLLTGALAAMCPGALLMRAVGHSTGTVSGFWLFLGGAVFVAGTIYSGVLVLPTRRPQPNKGSPNTSATTARILNSE